LIQQQAMLSFSTSAESKHANHDGANQDPAHQRKMCELAKKNGKVPKECSLKPVLKWGKTG
jgi:hypothetical protein